MGGSVGNGRSLLKTGGTSMLKTGGNTVVVCQNRVDHGSQLEKWVVVFQNGWWWLKTSGRKARMVVRRMVVAKVLVLVGLVPAGIVVIKT